MKTNVRLPCVHLGVLIEDNTVFRVPTLRKKQNKQTNKQENKTNRAIGKLQKVEKFLGLFSLVSKKRKRKSVPLRVINK